MVFLLRPSCDRFLLYLPLRKSDCVLNNKILTIVTITYNRQKEIKQLYHSLLRQTSMNFNWLVIDDGSEDKTVEYINNISKTCSSFQIRIIQNKSIGKYKEINKALPKIKTKLVLFVDSDDYLVSNGVETIEATYNKYKDSGVKSLIFERGDGNAKRPMRMIPHEFVARRYYYLAKSRKYGDYSDVYVADAIKNFKFPEFKNEKFMSEGPLYYWFSNNYVSAFIPKIMIVGAYRENGLTKNIRKNQINNYNGTLYETNLYLGNDTPFLFRTKKGILYNYVALNSSRPYNYAFLKSDHKIIILLTFIPAFILYCINNIREMKK